jgi:AcrR family transcriptional regulator
MLSNKDLRKEKNKQAIKEAALEIAKTEGWQGVTIRKIADKVLYSAPIVYEHFKNKDDLFKNLVEDGFRDLTGKTFEAMDKVKSPEEKILKLAEVRFEFASKNQTLHHIMFDADNPDWQRFELIKSIGKLGDYVIGLLAEISQKPERSTEYFLNMICLIRGYTYFDNKMGFVKKMKVKFLDKSSNMNELFIDAIQRFLESIKS